MRRHRLSGRDASGVNHLEVAVAHGLAVGADARAVVLVEGESDQRALEVLAVRRGRDLAAEGVVVVPMGGVTNIGHFRALFGPEGLDLQIVGLCDVGEVGEIARGMGHVGWSDGLTAADLDALGFDVCVEDLEDELIRALGVPAVEAAIAAEGELASLRTFRKQPAQRGRAADAQLRRFMGTRSGRKIRYGGVLVAALDLARVPAPLDAVLDRVARPS